MPAGEQFARTYPGLLPDSVEIWRAWLRRHELEFSLFEYNVRVGEGIRPPAAALTTDPKLDKTLREHFRQLTQKRIDVVAHKAEEVWILEIAARPGVRELGQLMLYEELLVKARPELPSVMLGLICNRLGADMEVTLRKNGIEIWQVSPAGKERDFDQGA